jgi:hypothetical protein
MNRSVGKYIGLFILAIGIVPLAFPQSQPDCEATNFNNKDKFDSAVGSCLQQLSSQVTSLLKRNPGQSPLKVRGGSVTGTNYNNSGKSAWTDVTSTSVNVSLTAGSLELDGVGGAGNKTPAQLYDYAWPPNGNWAITVTMRTKLGNLGDPTTTLTICSKQDCSIDSTSPVGIVYLKAPSNGQLGFIGQPPTISTPSWTDLTYSVLCDVNGNTSPNGTPCPETAQQSHVYSVAVQWSGQDPTTYYCPDALCVVAVNP